MKLFYNGRRRLKHVADKLQIISDFPLHNVGVCLFIYTKIFRILNIKVIRDSNILWRVVSYNFAQKEELNGLSLWKKKRRILKMQQHFAMLSHSTQDSCKSCSNCCTSPNVSAGASSFYMSEWWGSSEAQSVILDLKRIPNMYAVMVRIRQSKL